MTVTAPARVHGVSVQTARAPSSVPPVPSPAGKTAPGGKTAAVLRVTKKSRRARGGVSHLCSAAETPPFSSSAVGAARPSNAHASGGRFPPSASARREPPKFAPDRCTGRPAGGPLRRVARATSRKAPPSSRRRAPRTSRPPSRSRRCRTGPPRRSPWANRSLRLRASRSTAHRATSPAPPEGNVSACGPRASERHSACPSGREQRWHESLRMRRRRMANANAGTASARVSARVSARARERERETWKMWKMRRGEAREDRGRGSAKTRRMRTSRGEVEAVHGEHRAGSPETA